MSAWGSFTDVQIYSSITRQELCFSRFILHRSRLIVWTSFKHPIQPYSHAKGPVGIILSNLWLFQNWPQDHFIWSTIYLSRKSVTFRTSLGTALYHWLGHQTYYCGKEGEVSMQEWDASYLHAAQRDGVRLLGLNEVTIRSPHLISMTCKWMKRIGLSVLHLDKLCSHKYTSQCWRRIILLT